MKPAERPADLAHLATGPVAASASWSPQSYNSCDLVTPLPEPALDTTPMPQDLTAVLRDMQVHARIVLYQWCQVKTQPHIQLMLSPIMHGALEGFIRVSDQPFTARALVV